MDRVDNQHLLDAMLVQQPEHLCLGRVLAHRDQALLGCHHRGYRRVELLFKAQIAVRNDPDHLLADDDRHSGYAAAACELEHLADRHVG